MQVNEISRLAAEGPGEGEDILDGDVSLAAFYRADIRAVEPSAGCQFLLRKARRCPEATHVASEDFLRMGLRQAEPHKQATTKVAA